MGRIRTKENIAVGTLLIGIATPTGGYMIVSESELNPLGPGLWSYSNRKPLSSSAFSQVFSDYVKVCTAGSHFAGLTWVYSIAEHNGCYKTGKPELRYQPSYPGYLNRKYACKPLSMFLRLYSGYHWRQVLFDSYFGLSKTYDSQGGKPPRDLWFASSMQILKGIFWGWEKQRDGYNPEKYQRDNFKGLSHSIRARWHGRDKLLHLLYYKTHQV